MKNTALQKIEIDLLLKAIRLRYGYDFRNYSRASLKRRLTSALCRTKFNALSEMITPILHDPHFFEAVFSKLSITVTEMFRNPKFYRALRDKVIPVLKTYPFIKIWHAGCATGEEAYSMAILLKEEGLYEKTQIYATDFNDEALKKAKEGIFPMKSVKQYTANYQRGGGRESLGDYYHAQYDSVIMNQSLKKNITFANHNLATDGVFGEMNLILCRNVLIYFDKPLKNRALGLYKESLCYNGFFCLGNKEDLRFSEVDADFVSFVKKEKIYQKKGVERVIHSA